MKISMSITEARWKSRNPNGREYWNVYVSLPNGRKKQMRYSRYIAEQVLGKPLPPKAVVHHVDGDSLYDYPSNLVICEDNKYHMLLHVRAEALRLTANVNSRKCSFCKQWGIPGEGDMVTALKNNRPGGVGASAHKKCHALYEQKRRSGEQNKTVSNFDAVSV